MRFTNTLFLAYRIFLTSYFDTFLYFHEIFLLRERRKIKIETLWSFQQGIQLQTRQKPQIPQQNVFRLMKSLVQVKQAKPSQTSELFMLQAMQNFFTCYYNNDSTWVYRRITCKEGLLKYRFLATQSARSA